MANRLKRSPERETIFLNALATGSPVAVAATAAGIGYRTAFEWREGDQEFARRWEEAYKAGTDVMENEARRRAFEGFEEPVFHQGQVCGHVRKFSDNLLMFLLKARDPDRFKDRVSNELTGKLTISHEEWLQRLK